MGSSGEQTEKSLRRDLRGFALFATGKQSNVKKNKKSGKVRTKKK